MYCKRCGARMHLVRRAVNGPNVFVTYVCPQASCQCASVVVETERGKRAPVPGAEEAASS